MLHFGGQYAGFCNAKCRVLQNGIVTFTYQTANHLMLNALRGCANGDKIAVHHRVEYMAVAATVGLQKGAILAFGM